MSARRKRRQGARERRTAQVVRRPCRQPELDMETLSQMSQRYRRKLRRRGEILEQGHPLARRRVQLAAGAALVAIDGQRLRPQWWQYGRRFRRWLTRVAERQRRH